MADIFDILNGNNISMQRKMASSFTAADKIDGMKHKMDVWKCCMSKNRLDMFHKLSATITETDSKLETSVLRDWMSEHLTVLEERLEMYFPSEENP